MSITCTVLLFAHLADAVGQSQLSIELPDRATVKDAVDAVAQQHPAIAQHRHTLAIAVNETYAQPNEIVFDNATIALIPPVSGG